MENMSHAYSRELVQKGQAILDDKDSPIGEVKDRFLELLAQQHISYTAVVNTSDTLTHPKNRNGLMLNPFNAHRNGSLIRRVGANKKELHGACCIELCPHPAKRQASVYISFKPAGWGMKNAIY